MKIELTGKKIGLLTIRCKGATINRRPYWQVTCDCDPTAPFDVLQTDLTRGLVTSCGCAGRTAAAMSKLIDLIGQRFGRLIVMSRAENKGGHTAWNCLCDCGKECVVLGCNLWSGRVHSCGCLRSERRIKHGHTIGGKPSREYRAWRNAKTRCYNPNFKQFKDYGGRGITMCQEWRADFSAFYRDLGDCPPSFSLGRIDNDKGYSPGNCRWENNKQQVENRRSTRFLECCGVRMTLTGWARELGMWPTTLSNKLKRGITLDSLVQQSHQMPLAA